MNSVKFSYLVYDFNLNFVVKFYIYPHRTYNSWNFKVFTHMKRVYSLASSPLKAFNKMSEIRIGIFLPLCIVMDCNL